MAVTKTIVKCTPYMDSNSKVDKWDIEMTYENDNEGDATYYKSKFSTTVEQKDYDIDGNVTATNFTLKAKGSWTNANLVAICPVSRWDTIFASQVDSVITNPVVFSTPDNEFNVPS
jgi:hypothetical protein|tara:strand:- start:35 stop:382 length:348 start_codon:yes stop_codon:yes gene_type:complete